MIGDSIMKLYTALGRYTMKETASGEKIPHVIIGDTTYELDLWEMIVWSSLIWNIYTYDEIPRATQVVIFPAMIT